MSTAKQILDRFCKRLVELDMDIFGLRKPMAQDADIPESEIKGWRSTESGAHFPVKKGQTVAEAAKEFVTEKKTAKATKQKNGGAKKTRAEIEASKKQKASKITQHMDSLEGEINKALAADPKKTGDDYYDNFSKLELIDVAELLGDENIKPYITENDYDSLSDIVKNIEGKYKDLLGNAKKSGDRLANYMNAHTEKWEEEHGQKKFEEQLMAWKGKVLSNIPIVEKQTIKSFKKLGSEFDSGEKPNVVPPDHKDWGVVPGVYTVYRSGNMDNGRGVFTANTYEGAAPYAMTISESYKNKDLDRPFVDSYTVEIEKPFVSKTLQDAYMKLFHEKLPDKIWRYNGLENYDIKIMEEAKRRGYDAWVQLEPLPPAKKELVVLGDKARKNMQRTSRKIDEKAYVKELENNFRWAQMYDKLPKK